MTRKLQHNLRIIVSVLILTISGCSDHGHLQRTSAVGAHVTSEQRPPASTAPAKTATAMQDTASGPVQTCMRELISLSKVNPQAYSEKKRVFDGLMKNATVYSTVRGNISDSTRDMMDALYKYKTQKICDDIEHSVQQALVEHGENIK
ncbi:hypothetical protein [Enterobacter bugandensis]|uniref:hypothetical protein n=1 Tax=Enterobacter bugandensis TaxID=881260 RepID=UPI000FCBED9D|nr:hypothetical protein [Enterobacter bugandensis]